MPLAIRCTGREKVSLADVPTDSRGPFAGREDAEAVLAGHLARLADLQAKLFAARKHSLLVVLQATDTAGKDGVIRKVLGPLDARGIHVWGFGAPTPDELAHDFLWRLHARTPAAGEIAVFNRSYYEDVLVVRVLDLAPKAVWSRRFDHINAFEAMLRDEGTTVVKFFLHISKEEQKRRLQSRLDDPNRRWKFDPRDLEMRERWDDFQSAYEAVLSKCATEDTPWWIIPSDRKWYRDVAVAETLANVLESMAPKVPAITFDPATVVVK